MQIKSLRNVMIRGVRYKREVEIPPRWRVEAIRATSVSDYYTGVALWLAENCAGKYLFTYSTVKFQRKDDALMFALRFG